MIVVVSEAIVDVSGFPCVRITYPAEMSLDDIERLMVKMLDIHKQRGPFLTIDDISKLDQSKVTALHRKRLAEHTDRLAERGALIAEIVVVPSLLLRAVFTGYSWMRQRNSHPLLACATVDEANREAAKILAARRAVKGAELRG